MWVSCTKRTHFKSVILKTDQPLGHKSVKSWKKHPYLYITFDFVTFCLGEAHVCTVLHFMYFMCKLILWIPEWGWCITCDEFVCVFFIAPQDMFETSEQGGCPTPGCKGVGHIKGARYSGHHRSVWICADVYLFDIRVWLISIIWTLFKGA